MDEKPWYKSKLVWLGIVQFGLGSLGVLWEFLERGDFSAPAVVVLFSGILTVVLRVWFTDTTIKLG